MLAPPRPRVGTVPRRVLRKSKQPGPQVERPTRKSVVRTLSEDIHAARPSHAALTLWRLARSVASQVLGRVRQRPRCRFGLTGSEVVAAFSTEPRFIWAFSSSPVRRRVQSPAASASAAAL